MCIVSSVTSIGDSAFQNCSNLTSVTIGKSVTSIGDDAFSGCGSLTKVNYTGTIDQWVQIEFGDMYSNPIICSRNLYINDTLVAEANITTATKINAYAFRDCSSLTSVTIGNSVKSIEDDAFSFCDSLTSATIGNSVKSIGVGAFVRCYSLTSVTIPDSVTSIGSSAFGNCISLTSITIGDSVTSIGDNAFSECISLTSVTIGSSITSIGTWAFADCSSLTNVYYNGTAEQWNKISIGYVNSILTNTTRYYYSKNKPIDDGNYWHYDTDGVTPVKWDIE